MIIRHDISGAGRYLALLLVICNLSLGLEGCGFRLRGADMAISMPPTAVVSRVSNSDLKMELSRSLRNNGVEVVSDPAQAQVIVVITREDARRRVLSVGSSGRAQEYELRYEASFELKDQQGVARLDPQTIVLERDFSFDETQVLAKAGEEALLYRDMRRDAVREILRRMQTVVW